jgi:hypothetical protein
MPFVLRFHPRLQLHTNLCNRWWWWWLVTGRIRSVLFYSTTGIAGSTGRPHILRIPSGTATAAGRIPGRSEWTPRSKTRRTARPTRSWGRPPWVVQTRAAVPSVPGSTVSRGWERERLPPPNRCTPPIPCGRRRLRRPRGTP